MAMLFCREVKPGAELGFAACGFGKSWPAGRGKPRGKCGEAQKNLTGARSMSGLPDFDRGHDARGGLRVVPEFESHLSGPSKTAAAALAQPVQPQPSMEQPEQPE